MNHLGQAGSSSATDDADSSVAGEEDPGAALDVVDVVDVVDSGPVRPGAWCPWPREPSA